MDDEADRYRPVSRPYRQRFGRLISDHVFDKLRSIDVTLAEFVELLNHAAVPPEVIAEARDNESELKELVLLVEWKRPLHVAIVVDDAREQERVATAYEPYPAEFRRRR